IQGGVARVLARGLQGTGYTYGPLRRAETGCDGQSSCIAGCPISAKRSTAVSFLPEALKRNAFLFSHMRVKKILVENGQAVGVVAGVPGFGQEFEMTVKARMVVLAAGTFGTPQVLYRSGLHKSNSHIGRHLTIHPAFTIGGLFSEVVRETLFVPQSLGVFGIEGGDYVLEGYTLPVDGIPAAMGQWGKELTGLMSEVQHFTNFSSMMRDVSEGQLILTPWGALPYYYVTPELMRNAQESLKMMAKIFFKAGAKKVHLPIQGREVITSLNPIAELDNESIHPARIIISAHHPLGTCRMARTEYLGAVSPEGEFFSVKNLVVADGSTIPGPLGVNPQVTIMANALRLADIWSQRL
ncbi:MAG: GMC family oxidoreductase N-terminal domain-containing protein, partial [Bdellovibrionota bacterium]